jgi:hypothetical protein
VAALDREVLGRPSQERQRAGRDEVLPSARVVACDVDVCNNRPHRRGERTMGALAVGEYMRVGRPWGALARVPEDEVASGHGGLSSQSRRTERGGQACPSRCVHEGRGAVS